MRGTESSFPNGQSGRSHEYQENVRTEKVYSKWNIQLSSIDNAERTLLPRISTTLRYSRKRVGCNRARRNQLRNMCCKVYSRSLRYLIWNILSLLLSFLKKSEQLAFRSNFDIKSLSDKLKNIGATCLFLRSYISLNVRNSVLSLRQRMI